jgi:hypothetical protein
MKANGSSNAQNRPALLDLFLAPVLTALIAVVTFPVFLALQVAAPVLGVALLASSKLLERGEIRLFSIDLYPSRLLDLSCGGLLLFWWFASVEPLNRIRRSKNRSLLHPVWR